MSCVVGRDLPSKRSVVVGLCLVVGLCRRWRQVHEALSLLESAWQLVLPPSSFVVPRLSSQTRPLLLLLSLPWSSLYHFSPLDNMCSCHSVAQLLAVRPGFEPLAC